MAEFRDPGPSDFQPATLTRLLGLMCLASILACCGKDSPTEPVSTSVVLSSASLTFNALGISQQVTATVRDQRGLPMPTASVSWTSKDPQVATVSTVGLVTAVSNGTTTISASSGAASASLAVNVAQVAASVNLSKSNLSFSSVGDTARLTATVMDVAGAVMPGATVTWTSLNVQIASISSEGLVTAVANGTTTISASSGAAVASLSVAVTQVAASVSLSKSNLSFASLSDTARLAATVIDAAGAVMPGAAVTWASLNVQVASVSSAGLVTAVENGTTTVSATAGAATASTQVRVAQVPARLHKLRGDGQVAAIGEELPDTLAVSVMDALDHPVRGVEVTWTPATAGGKATPSSSITDERGLAASRWTLGLSLGEQRLAAAIPGVPAIPPVTFIAQGQSPITLGPRQFIAAGGIHTCALTELGQAYCWGDNRVGTLGTGGARYSTTPTSVQTAVRFASVAAGYAHSCGLTSLGRVYCWGWNANGEGGNGTVTTATIPIPVGGNLLFTSVTAGEYHTCALAPGGTAYCWGGGYDGQLGTGSNSSATLPQEVIGGIKFRSITAGGSHTCGLALDGRAYCWGSGGTGQLGTGSRESSPTPRLVMGGHTFSEIDAGGVFTCGIAGGGQPYCWGWGFPDIPTSVVGTPALLTLSVGHLTACGVATGGQGFCWGLNLYGNRGDGTHRELDDATGQPIASQVMSAASLRTVSVGGGHVCALTEDNRAICWGHRDWGRLGDGLTAFAPSPVTVAGGRAWREVSSGYNHRCGIDDEGGSFCWGDNHGKLGDGQFDSRSTPSQVTGGLIFRQLAAGGHYTCAIAIDSRGYCWGANAVGSLGIGRWDGYPDRANPMRGYYPSPVAMTGGHSFTEIASDCALDANGAAFCWGENRAGRLGTGSFSGPEQCGIYPCSTKPLQVQGGLTFTSIARHRGFTRCGLGQGGRAYCWGENDSGQVGDGTTANRATPVEVGGAHRFATLTVGSDHTCGLTDGGKAYCWGNDSWGRLGNGSYSGMVFASPAEAAVGKTFKALAAGIAATCGLTSAGDIYCWGANAGGLLGVGSLEGPDDCFGVPCSRAPILVGSGFTAVTAGAFSACGVRESGLMQCWGWREWGALGDGVLGYEHTPVFSNTGLRFGPTGWPGLTAYERSEGIMRVFPPFLGAQNSTPTRFLAARRPSLLAPLEGQIRSGGDVIRYRSESDIVFDATWRFLGLGSCRLDHLSLTCEDVLRFSR